MTSDGAELERLRALVDELEGVVWEADAGGRFTFVSAGGERLLGYPREAWLADGFRAAHVHPEDRDATLRQIAEAASDGRPYDLEYRMIRSDGSVVSVRDLGHPLAATAGGGRGLMIDVSRRRPDDERRSEMDARQRPLIEELPAIVYTESVTEDEATVVYVSPRVREILGIDPQDWIGTKARWISRVHPDDRERVERATRRSDETGAPFVAEYRMTASDGRVVWFHDESAPVHDEEGRPLFWQGLMLDVTEQRRAAELEEALVAERARADALREADEVKNTYLQAVSHDLRTPLAAILGLATTLEREELQLAPAEARDLAARIANNARKLDRIVSDLLDLDRIRRGIVEPKRVDTDVGALVRRIVAESELVGDREIRVDARSTRAEIDPPKVERIVENLLANSARHTPSGARVWLRVLEEHDGVTIAVEDDGPGVSPELREIVFEPFRRGEGSPDHGTGLGIGLALVARFAELHEGRAWVEQRAGGGASFRVWLPAHPGGAA